MSFFLFLAGFAASALATSAHAAPIIFHDAYNTYSIESYETATWKTEEPVWTYEGESIVLPPEVDPESIPGMRLEVRTGWNKEEIAKTLSGKLLKLIEKQAGKVVIRKDANNQVIFDGVGIPGRTIQMNDAVTLAIAALESGTADVVLPIEETSPEIIVDDIELQELGITELVSMGESVYAGSPTNRKHNIANGLSKFNGHIVPQGETFSFNTVLGPVTPEEGYLKELTILGDKTLPDYGGGLCQVSTTAYRGAWGYGLPIPVRRNHSYAVSYYSPYGTDATIYPPYTDMKFTNNTPGALLIQTHHDENDHAYFLYYGTKDDRSTMLFGPYTWDLRSPPPEKTEYTTQIPAGTKRKVGEAVPGLKAEWFRIIRTGTGEVIDSAYSFYEARPRFFQIGIEGEGPAPEWIGGIDPKS